MSITVRWYDVEDSVIIINYEPGWSWGEYQAAFQQMKDMIAATEHKVDVINNASNACDPPDDKGFENLVIAKRNKPDNFGLMVTVCENGLMRKYGEIYYKLVGSRISYFVHTLDEAEELLSRKRGESLAIR